MNLSELSGDEIAQRARAGGLALWCGPFVVRVVSPIAALTRGLHRLYADHSLADREEFADFRLELAPRSGVRGRLKPQVVFTVIGTQPFAPLPLAQAYPLFEWAFNWSIASTANRYLILHAAVLERGGRVLIMPGPPGSGKSTLAAALVWRGWRLFSDELTLIDTERRHVVPLPRPISLKNKSVTAIQKFAPGAFFGETVHNTLKGSVAHMKPSAEHVRRAGETAGPGWIVFPKFEVGAAATLATRTKPDTLIDLARNAFNYNIQGKAGFAALAAFVDASQCFSLRYGDLNDAVAIFERLAPEGP